ncbi:MAG: hypothetical protein Q4F83_08435 [Eubacteriales bacterium]|nr:hypothetical protein [Eubacteriales bacterium]
MLMHMKYELRKSMFSKMVILLVTAVSEIAFLAGVFLKNNTALMWGITGLSMCAVVGIFYIGIESLLTFHKDLNTKQSYMLFMTPQTSYTILGAKVLQNALAIFAAGAFFVLIAVLDVVTATIYMDGLQALIDMVQELMKNISVQINIEPQNIIMAVAVTLVSWLMMIATGYLAIVLSATILAGKKLSGFVSFVLYLIINFGALKILDLVPYMKNQTLQGCLVIALSFIITVILYLISGWIMERKLSV